LEDIKFQNIIGEEYFEDEEKYMFDAAPDHVLYDKALQTIESHTGAQPYFLAMQTISSHVPYDTPFGK
jgi:phosphoglycerol transferase MdoB-like AlkP superfamily enzyme